MPAGLSAAILNDNGFFFVSLLVLVFRLVNDKELNCCVQKYRLYLKRVSGVSPSQGRRGVGSQPDWPQMLGPHVGMGMGPAQSPMGPMPPVSYPGCLSVYKQFSLMHFSLIRCLQNSLWVLVKQIVLHL